MSVKVPSMASALAHCQETVPTMSSPSSRLAVISVPTLGRVGFRVTVPASSALLTVMETSIVSIFAAGRGHDGDHVGVGVVVWRRPSGASKSGALLNLSTPPVMLKCSASVPSSVQVASSAMVPEAMKVATASMPSTTSMGLSGPLSAPSSSTFSTVMVTSIISISPPAEAMTVTM